MAVNAFETVTDMLRQSPKTWLVTGIAGFIGSNLLEALLKLDQRVVGLDNFATGHRSNLAEVQSSVQARQWANFTFHEGDIRDAAICAKVCEGVDYVLHEAALGSVPRSIKDPAATNDTNVSGFLNMLVAARDAKVGRFVYAASSSTYGDHPGLPKVEDKIGKPLSPYAVTKLVNELYADVFDKAYGFKSIGLRYFNVFGPRQDPNGAYAAVIPKWVSSLINGETVVINGDGETSRDFCFVYNVVQANILAATVADLAGSEVFNVAVGERSTLNVLFSNIRTLLAKANPAIDQAEPRYGAFRSGDVRHSLADIGKASTQLGYRPTHTLRQGLEIALPWYLSRPE